MTSIRTNAGALIALQTLKTLSRALGTAQNRISTGKRINSAADSPAVWAVAKTMEVDRSSAKVIQSGLTVAEQVVSVAAVGADAVTDQLIRIHDRLLDASNGNSDAGNNLQEIKGIIGRMSQTISSASLNGVNLLSNKGVGVAERETYTILASLQRSYGEVATKVSVIDVESANLEMSPLSELKNYFLFQGDHDPTVNPPVSGTPLEDGQVALPQSAEFTQAEYAAVLYAAKEEEAAFRKIARNRWPTSAETATYVEAFTAYHDAIIKFASLTDDQNADLLQIKEDVESKFARAGGSGNSGFKRSADRAREEFFGSTVDAGLEPSANYARAEGPYSRAGEAEKRLLYKKAYPPRVEVHDFGSVLARKLAPVVQALLEVTISKAAKLGTEQRRIESQAEALGGQADSLDRAISALIDTNLEVESARLKALQTQHQLAVQTLSIANRAPQSVLSLFNSNPRFR